MKLKFVSVVLIVVAICCLNVTADSDDDSSPECLENYLKQKGKLASNFPVRPVTSETTCRFVLVLSLALMRGIIDELITSKNPTSTCLVREFANQETLDLITKLNVIEESSLSENEMKTQTNETRNELKQDLAKIALQCETDVNKFTETFNDFLGIKNETLSALQHNYCFAKYASKHDLLPLKNVNLNPNGIETTNIDCRAIIRKERRSNEQDLRDTTKEKMPNSINCVMDVYKNNNVFDTSIATRVLEYVELSKEIKDAESKKNVNKIADFTVNVVNCALSSMY